MAKGVLPTEPRAEGKQQTAAVIHREAVYATCVLCAAMAPMADMQALHQTGPGTAA